MELWHLIVTVAVSTGGAVWALWTKLSLMDKAVDKVKSETLTKITDLDSGISQKITKLDSDISQKITDLDSDISEKITKLDSDISQKITDLDSDISEKITDLDSDISQKITKLDSDISQKIAALDVPIETLANRMDSIETRHRVDDALAEMRNQLLSSLKPSE